WGCRSCVKSQGNLEKSRTLFVALLFLHSATNSNFFRTKGICFNSFGEQSFSHKQYLFSLFKNSSAPKNFLIHFFDLGSFCSKVFFSCSFKNRFPPSVG